MVLAAIILIQVDMQTTVSSLIHNVTRKSSGYQGRAI
jgi:hypothetical protein